MTIYSRYYYNYIYRTYNEGDDFFVVEKCALESNVYISTIYSALCLCLWQRLGLQSASYAGANLYACVWFQYS